MWSFTWQIQLYIDKVSWRHYTIYTPCTSLNCNVFLNIYNSLEYFLQFSSYNLLFISIQNNYTPWNPAFCPNYLF